MNKEAYRKAARRLETRRRTVFELKAYLKEKEFSEEDINEVTEEFLKLGYLDDYVYCHRYFDYAFEKGKGKARVFAELKQKGVDEQIIRRAFDEYEEDVDELEIARCEARKILESAGICEDEEIPERIIGRTGRRLSGKGFPSSVIYTVIGEIRK